MLNLIKAIFYLAFFYYFADGWMIVLVIALGLLAIFLTRYSKKLQAEQEQPKEPFVTYADTCPDDNAEYGPEGSVIWGPRTIEENICINGKWYINENSEEWEESEE